MGSGPKIALIALLILMVVAVAKFVQNRGEDSGQRQRVQAEKVVSQKSAARARFGIFELEDVLGYQCIACRLDDPKFRFILAEAGDPEVRPQSIWGFEADDGCGFVLGGSSRWEQDFTALTAEQALISKDLLGRLAREVFMKGRPVTSK